MHKLIKGDDVVVITGKDKGKRGTVQRVLANGRVLVENINMIKRHTKANPTRAQAGGIVEKEAPIQVSNVALYNPATGKADRVGFRVLEDGRKVRFFKSNNEIIGA
ncbi:MAG: 50S ribosomal protein L24 [Gammaproteobacteria bacterium RBG_16_57_12]|nr:MAG: 50S ribosomal protein L24 [Gammaproteobacteria bacterium RBG_16_57_12]